MMEEYLEQFFTPLSHINSVNNSDKTQKIYADSLPIITEYSTKLSQNINIYKAYKDIHVEENCNLLTYRPSKYYLAMKVIIQLCTS